MGKGGLALSIGTKFVENVSGRQKKQDCELKAAYRLLEDLGKEFPQLRICLVLDSLYVSEEIIKICEKQRWKFIIGFKKGSAPDLYKEYEILKKLCSGNYLEYYWKKKKEKQFYRWVEGIDYKFEGKHYVNVLECKVRKEEAKKGKKESRWVWLTNFSITKGNCTILANEGGRLRWKEENEGFNIQKNGGYNLEHLYIKDYNGMKCIYLLIQIAHIFNQLIEKGNLLTKEIREALGSICEIAQ